MHLDFPTLKAGRDRPGEGTEAFEPLGGPDFEEGDLRPQAPQHPAGTEAFAAGELFLRGAEGAD